MEYRTIANHDGDIHLDELIADSSLIIQNPNLKIIRTRDSKILSGLDARVDVGEKYCPETNDFDHHQGAGERENGVPYAAAGLIWKHFGRPLCNSDETWSYVDKRLIQYVDLQDNGKKPDGDVYGLAKVIQRFNIKRKVGKATAEESFNEALEISKIILENEIIAAEEQVISNTKIRNILKNFQGLPYIILKESIGWEEVIVPETNDKLYVIYQSDHGDYRVRAIPKEIGGFENRKPLPKAWRGLTDEKLANLTGIKDFVFCHGNGFTGTTKTLDGAVQVAKLAASLMD